MCALTTYTLRETRVGLLYSIKYKLQTFNLLLRIECCQLDISSKLYFSSIVLFEEMRDCIFRDTLQLCLTLKKGECQIDLGNEFSAGLNGVFKFLQLVHQ